MVSILYFTADRSLFEIKKANTNWVMNEYETNWELMCVAVDPQKGRLYVGTFDHGLRISDDGGKTWRLAGNEIGRASCRERVKARDGGGEASGEGGVDDVATAEM